MVERMKIGARVEGDASRPSVSTYDFSTMYTSLPLGDLKRRIRTFVMRVFSRRLQSSRARFLLVRKDGSFAWLNCRKAVKAGKEFIFSAEDVSDMVDALVDRTYVRFGGKTYKQVVGIPMGTNCAGFLANLYCFTYELSFLERLISLERFDEARAFQNCQRYIDDLLCVGSVAEHFPEFMYKTASDTLGLYPKEYLKLSLADSGPRVPYMDIALCFSKSRGLYTAIYDKRLEAKYAGINVLRYPAIESILSDQAKYGIITSQLHRFSKRCMRACDFAYNAGLVMHRMDLKGYEHNLIITRVRSFLCRHRSSLFGGKRSVCTWLRMFMRSVQQLRDGVVRAGPYGPLRD